MPLLLLAFFQFTSALAGAPTLELQRQILAKIQNASVCDGCGWDEFPRVRAPSEFQCAKNYDALFGDGELNLSVALGYLDPVLDMDTPNGRHMTFIMTLLEPCNGAVKFACGFRRQEMDLGIPGTSFQVLAKRFLYQDSKGKLIPVQARISICNPFSPLSDPQAKENQQNFCAAFFSTSLKCDDVTIYTGHSRDGGGPDFFPPKTTAKGKAIDYGYYRRNRPGVRLFLSPQALRPAGVCARPQRKIFAAVSCSSKPHFAGRFFDVIKSSEDAGYPTESFGFIGTNRETFSDGVETISLVEALGNAQCPRELKQTYEHSSERISAVWPMVLQADGSFARSSIGGTFPGELNIDRFYK